MKVAVVMTYYKRGLQLLRTLGSISKTSHDDFVVIVVDDASEDGLVLPEVSFPLDLITISAEEKKWNNPEPVYNRGILRALKYNPDIIIIQNAECMHIGDVISFAAVNTTDNTYISFGCFALDQQTTMNTSTSLLDIQIMAHSCKEEAVNEGQMAWYNHPIYRNCELDFCASISVKNMIEINGYDERFMYGMAYGDNYLKHRIKCKGLNIMVPLSPFVAHQWHYAEWYWNKRDYGLMNNNGALYNKLTKECNPRAVHLITKNFDEDISNWE